MPPEQPAYLSRKFLGFILVGLITALFGGLAVMYYLGMFTTVTVMRMSAPSYRIAYLSHTGAYNDIQPSIEKAAEYLRHAGIEADTACALLLDNTGSTPESKRRAKVGYLLDASAYAPAPLEEEVFPAREVVMSTFSGGTLLGSYKVYEAMKKWARANHYALVLPALEIYHPDGVTEYQLGIRKD